MIASDIFLWKNEMINMIQQIEEEMVYQSGYMAVKKKPD